MCIFLSETRDLWGHQQGAVRVRGCGRCLLDAGGTGCRYSGGETAKFCHFPTMFLLMFNVLSECMSVSLNIRDCDGNKCLHFVIVFYPLEMSVV